MPTRLEKKPILERWLEDGLFMSRWLMAPFYIGLVVALGALVWVFVRDLFHEMLPLLTDPHSKPEDAILMALSLIDLSLAGNLLLIVTYSGYENFVSKIDTADHEDRPDWMGTVDFSGLKLKLIASIVAISGIALLKAFMKIGAASPGDHTGTQMDERALLWLVIIHLTFVLSGVALAAMDWITGKTKKQH